MLGEDELKFEEDKKEEKPVHDARLYSLIMEIMQEGSNPIPANFTPEFRKTVLDAADGSTKYNIEGTLGEDAVFKGYF